MLPCFPPRELPAWPAFGVDTGSVAALNDKQATVSSLKRHLKSKLGDLKSSGLLRSLKLTHRLSPAKVEQNGQRLLSFSSNDYLGLSQHPAVVKSARKALRKYGSGAGSSRLLEGNHPLAEELETDLARLKQTDSCLLFGSGYLANLGTISSIVSKPDLILIDALAHSCLRAGAEQTEARIEFFEHNNWKQVDRILQRDRKSFRHVLVITESVFSMDGDAAPLKNLSKTCIEHDAWFLIDDAHGLGTFAGGFGISTENLDPERTIITGTLSKSLGSYGGYVCGPELLRSFLVNRARTVVYTTGLPPASLAAAQIALTVMKNEPKRCQKAHKNACLFAELLSLPKPAAAVVPVVLGDDSPVIEVAHKLQKKGFLVSAIRPPTVPKGSARLRCSFSSAHSATDIKALAKAVAVLAGNRL